MKVSFSKPCIEDKEISDVVEVLKSGWLTSGPKVEAFESAFSRYLGVKNSLALNSGTSALLLGMKALGVGPGDKVLIPAVSFCSAAAAVNHLGAEPVFCDIDPKTLNMEPQLAAIELEKANGAIKVVVPVHMAGQMCEMDKITQIAAEKGAKVLEDAAHVLPGEYLGRPVGTWGDAAIFSFYATKPVCSAEGGMLVLKDDEVFERARKLRFHGIDRDVWDRYQKAGRSWDYDVVEPGFKFNMTEIAAVLGINQLGKADEFLAKRSEIANTYLENINWGEDLQPPFRDDKATKHSWHLFIVRSERRDELADFLASQGIGCSFHFRPLHTMTAWKRAPGRFPASEKYWKEGLSLPLFNSMKKEQCLYVCEKINQFFG